MTTPTKTRPNKALELLHTEVANTLNSNSWQEALRFHRRFQYKYSLSNILLIICQRPEATLVAGFKKWLEAGRSVNKGEKGIAILAPLVRRITTDDGEDERRVFGFRTAYVFDVAQTSGDDIPMPPAPTVLEGHEDAARAALEVLEASAAKHGWAIRDLEPEQLGSARGAWYPDRKAIALRSDLPPLQRLKTLVHELAHAHAGHEGDLDADRAKQEFEAETAAFLVLDALELDTSAYTFHYLAGWAGSPEAMRELTATGKRATELAETILEDLRQAEA